MTPRTVSVWRIAAHEWRTMRRDGGLVVGAVLFAAALAWGLSTGARWQDVVDAGIVNAQTDERERYDRLAQQVQQREAAIARGEEPRGGDPRSASTLSGRTGSRAAILPPAPLAALSVGQSDLLPSAMRVSTEPREQMRSVSEIENPHRLLEGRFDASFVLIYLYPLLILAFSYNLLAGEKEQGTLALLLSQPVSLARLMTGKVVIRLLGFVGITLVMALGGLWATGASLTAAGTWLSFAWWLLAVVVYGAFWFAVALAVGSLGRSSAATALGVAGVWLLFVLVLPSLANLAVNALYPVPSRVEMVQATREASEQASTRGSALLARYFEDHPEMVPVVSAGETANALATRFAVADEVARLVEPVLTRYDSQLAQQRRVASWLRLFSPALLIRDVFDDVAGTSQARHTHFANQVDTFHRQWQEFFAPRVVSRVALQSTDEVPRFEFREESTASVTTRMVTNLAVILAAAFPLAVLSIRRLPRLSLSE
jgi:ABC-2 type transport system permease protein